MQNPCQPSLLDPHREEAYTTQCFVLKNSLNIAQGPSYVSAVTYHMWESFDKWMKQKSRFARPSSVVGKIAQGRRPTSKLLWLGIL